MTHVLNQFSTVLCSGTWIQTMWLFTDDPSTYYAIEKSSVPQGVYCGRQRVPVAFPQSDFPHPREKVAI